MSGAVGAVGQAATKAKGARVIALVRNASQLPTATSINVEAIAQSDTGNLGIGYAQGDKRQGVDLALNGVRSSIMGILLNCLGLGGRQVVYSAAGGREFPLDILSFYQKQPALMELTTLALDATQCADIAPLFESGALKPPHSREKVSAIGGVMPSRDVLHEAKAPQSRNTSKLLRRG